MNANTINDDVTRSGPATMLAGRYRVIRQLGQGGMGSVWLAEDAKLDNRQVAVKMLPSVLVSNKRAYNQLKAEALVSLKLTHPNIAAVRAFEENDGNPFLVIDYIDGQTLDDYLAKKGKLDEETTYCLLEPVARALDYAHEKGVVHRDVKPGNVMVTWDGDPYVLDFGIAREIQETMTRVTGKESSGTLMYMSPEQLHGAVPTPAQDIYSFAAMAYECLTGHPPFSHGQIEYQIEHDTPAPLDPQFANCGSGVMAGLAKDPALRPPSCHAVLSVAGKGTRIGNGPVASPKSRNRPKKVGFWLLLTAALAPVVLAGVFGLMALQALIPADEKKMAENANAFALDAKPGSVVKVAVGQRQSAAGTAAEIVFCHCPAGTFMMGYEDALQIAPLRKVSITHPFWITQTPLTVAQVEAMGLSAKGDLSKGPAVRAQFDLAKTVTEDLPRVLTGFMPKLPDGYVLRLPTEAELEYVMKAGTLPGDPRLKMKFEDECDSVPNPWHVRHLFNSGILLLSDRVPPWRNNRDIINRANGKSDYWSDLVRVDYSMQPAEDPLAWCADKDWRMLRRGGGGGKYTATQSRLFSCSAYYVVAPALEQLNKFYWK